MPPSRSSRPLAAPRSVYRVLSPSTAGYAACHSCFTSSLGVLNLLSLICAVVLLMYGLSLREASLSSPTIKVTYATLLSLSGLELSTSLLSFIGMSTPSYRCLLALSVYLVVPLLFVDLVTFFVMLAQRRWIIKWLEDNADDLNLSSDQVSSLEKFTQIVLLVLGAQCLLDMLRLVLLLRIRKSVANAVRFRGRGGGDLLGESVSSDDLDVGSAMRRPLLDSESDLQQMQSKLLLSDKYSDLKRFYRDKYAKGRDLFGGGRDLAAGAGMNSPADNAAGGGGGGGGGRGAKFPSADIEVVVDTSGAGLVDDEDDGGRGGKEPYIVDI